MKIYCGLIAGLAGMALLPGVVAAQTTEPAEPEVRPIVTDRPDFTEGATSVGKHRFQVETGFTVELDENTRFLDLPEALIRYGLDTRWEMRFGFANYDRLQTHEAETVSGFGDTYVGVKYQVGPFRDGTDFSIIPAVFLPSKDRDFSSGSVDPEVKFCAARDIGGGRSLSGMVYLAYPTEDGQRNFTEQLTLSFGQPITAQVGSFLEWSSVIPDHGETQNVLHAGLTYQPAARQQFDIHFGFGMNHAAPDSFIAGGYAFCY